MHQSEAEQGHRHGYHAAQATTASTVLSGIALWRQFAYITDSIVIEVGLIGVLSGGAIVERVADSVAIAVAIDTAARCIRLIAPTLAGRRLVRIGRAAVTAVGGPVWLQYSAGPKKSLSFNLQTQTLDH